MQILASGRNRAVAERGLHQMNWGAAVEGVRTVSMLHPVGRDIKVNACPAQERCADLIHGAHAANGETSGCPFAAFTISALVSLSSLLHT